MRQCLSQLHFARWSTLVLFKIHLWEREEEREWLNPERLCEMGRNYVLGLSFVSCEASALPRLSKQGEFVNIVDEAGLVSVHGERDNFERKSRTPDLNLRRERLTTAAPKKVQIRRAALSFKIFSVSHPERLPSFSISSSFILFFILLPSFSFTKSILWVRQIFFVIWKGTCKG